jgi:hypothetical protein
MIFNKQKKYDPNSTLLLPLILKYIDADYNQSKGERGTLFLTGGTVRR